MTRSLKIGFVIDDTLDSTDGVQQFTLGLGRQLHKMGHQIRYLTSEASEDHPEGKYIYRLSRAVKARMNGNRVGTPLPASKRKIRAILEKEQFDILHVTTPYSPVLAGRVISAASDDTAIVGTFHIAVDTPVAEYGAKLLSWLQFRSLSRFDYWTAVSDAAVEFAKTCYRIVPEVITPNPIDFQAYYKPKKLATYKTDKFRIAFLGRLVERKGAQHLLSAIALLPKAVIADLDVAIGGNGPLRQDLEKFVVDQKLGDNVTFFGFIPEADKASFLDSAELACFPSTAGECFGISLLEGMAVGSTAVVGGYNKGYVTVLGDSKLSLVEAANHKLFARRLELLIKDKAVRQSMIDWQNKAILQYDVPKVAEGVLTVYHEAMKRRH